jgi:hypothetical protein
MEVEGTMYPPNFGLKLPVVKARAPNQKCPRSGGWVWRFWVDALVFGGRSDDGELALDDARSKKQWAYYRRVKISGETQDLGSLCFDIFAYNDL